MSLELALEWAKEGHRVLPVNSATKRPLIKAWQQECTTDEMQVWRWWQAWPNARVGIATGDPGFDVLDFDVAEGKPGIAQLEKLMDQGVLVPGTFKVVSTPSGGRHLYFRGSDQHNKQNDKAIPGVDFRGVGGMVVAAGNPGYKWVSGRGLDYEDLKPIDWEAIVACLVPEPVETKPNPAPLNRPSSVVHPRSTGKLVAPMRFDNAPGEESPLDWFCRNNDLGAMLNADGWSYAYTTEGRDYYVRPGKDPSGKDGISANIWVNPDGRQTLINFSSTVGWLPTDRGMSAAQYLAYRDYNGDTRRAAGMIRTTMMPRRETAPARPLPVSPVTQTALARPSPPPGPAGVSPGLPGAELDGPRGGQSNGSIPSSDLVPIAEVGQPPLVRDFWLQRDVLRRIRWIARERRVSPWATLGAVLAQASCRIGPHVVLPPIVGGVASLNLLVGLVGPSGKGKGAATAVAAEFLGVGTESMGQFMMEEVGTSQGIDSSFTETTAKAGTIQFNDVAFFYVPEIDTVKAHAEMAGSALLPTLRKIWSGEALGAKYAAKERRRPVRAHAYRASVVAGIQPRRSGVLLNDLDGGTPQRWLWLPVTDPAAIRRTDRLIPPGYQGGPPRLEFDVWLPVGEKRGEKDEPLAVVQATRYEIPVCQKAQDAILDARELSLVSEEATIDSHGLLTRLKVAALLAFLDRRMEVTEDDWDLAEPIMWMSNVTRAACQNALAEAEEEEHHKRGRGRAMVSLAEQVAAPALRDRRTDRIQELGLKALHVLQAEPGKEFSPKQLREAAMDAKARREFGDDVMAAVVATPGVNQGPEISSGGRKIRKLSWQPVIA